MWQHVATVASGVFGGLEIGSVLAAGNVRALISSNRELVARNIQKGKAHSLTLKSVSDSSIPHKPDSVVLYFYERQRILWK